MAPTYYIILCKGNFDQMLTKKINILCRLYFIYQINTIPI